MFTGLVYKCSQYLEKSDIFSFPHPSPTDKFPLSPNMKVSQLVSTESNQIQEVVPPSLAMDNQ